MDATRDSRTLYVVLATASLATLLLHAFFVPRHFAAEPTLAYTYLAAGWGTYTIAWYTVGRLVSTPQSLPGMRAADVGVSLLLVSVLASGALASWGVTPATAVEVYLVLATGVYVGLGLTGFALGRRTNAITRLAGS